MGRGIVLPDDPHVITQTTTPALASGGGSPLCRPSEPATANAPGSLMLFAVVAIQPSESLDVSDAELVVEGGGKRRSRVPALRPQTIAGRARTQPRRSRRSQQHLQHESRSISANEAGGLTQGKILRFGGSRFANGLRPATRGRKARTA
jgi:hypothetical protein